MEQLPIFPLNTVLFPGATLSLHIFEERYRALVRHLLSVPDPSLRLLGIVAIREGYEVAGPGEQHRSQSMYRVGTVAQLTSSEPYDDGRFDIEVVGRSRMRVDAVDTSGAYLVAEVELLAEDRRPGGAAAEAAARALMTFEEYRSALSGVTGTGAASGPLPRDPEVLSFVLAASALLTLPARQRLLEAETAAERLTRLRRELREEIRAMRALPSLPAAEMARQRWSPN